MAKQHTGWTCPRCGRQFANANQSHSCKSPVAVAAHFEDRPAWMRAAFDRIANKLGDSIRVSGVAKGIHLAARSTFAGVRMTKDKMHVEFLLDEVVKSPRIRKVEKFSATRIAHHVELTDSRGADAELIAWLKASRDGHA
ncbi:MAG TPA: DUF5655 domain-containing protein [Vicinamibacterales bacterium]